MITTHKKYRRPQRATAFLDLAFRPVYVISKEKSHMAWQGFYSTNTFTKSRFASEKKKKHEQCAQTNIIYIYFIPNLDTERLFARIDAVFWYIPPDVYEMKNVIN